MSVSDRLTGRVAGPELNLLIGRPPASIKGADGGRSAPTRQVERVGSRQLSEIRASLTAVDWDVLQSLAKFHYLTTRQIQRLHFNQPARSIAAASRASRRRLQQLYEQRVVDRLDRRIGGVRAGSASYVLTVSPIGARLLESSTRRRAREPSLLHLDHVLAVAELAVQLHEAHTAGATIVRRLEPEPACWRPFIARHGARGLLKPDLRVTVADDGRELHWFIEVDRGTEHAPVLRRKMRTYIEAWQAGVDQLDGVFPQVLWVVPDEGRGDAIESALRSLRGLPNNMAVIATTTSAVEVITGSQR